MNDDFYIERTLELAVLGKGCVSPNPMVGCVIVKNGEVIGEGYHHEFGEKHAEVDAFDNCREDPAGATLYVNLEPCSHYGKTPPCTELIIRKKISRVVIGMQDPNPLVNGAGISKLREAGIGVDISPLAQTCLEFNRFFVKFVIEQKPFITLKAAQTIDGKIADSNGVSKWISSASSRKLVHRMRAEYDAVMTGSGTVIADNPLLNVRDAEGRDPDVILVDAELKISPDFSLFHLPSERKIYIITNEKFNAGSARPRGYDDLSTDFILVPEISPGKLDLDAALDLLAQKGIASILVEGGAGLFSSLIEEKLYDELAVFIAPKLLGSGKNFFSNSKYLSMNEALNLRLHKLTQIDEDILAIYRKQ